VAAQHVDQLRLAVDCADVQIEFLRPRLPDALRLDLDDVAAALVVEVMIKTWPAPSWSTATGSGAPE